MLKVSGSVLTFFQVTLIRGGLEVKAVDEMKKIGSYIWGPVVVHPACWLGKVIWYAQVEARKESTKITPARIRTKRRVRGKWKKERIAVMWMDDLEICSLHFIKTEQTPI
jgi:hypothetical protein